MIHESNCPYHITLLIKDCTCTHTHGEHGSHTRVVEKGYHSTDDFDKTKFSKVWVKGKTDFLQFICLDDGVIYKEIEITREGK